jgi:hypothetical protein
MLRIPSGKPRKLKWDGNGRGSSLLNAEDASSSLVLRLRRRAPLRLRAAMMKTSMLHDEFLGDTFNDNTSAYYLYIREYLKFSRRQCAHDFSNKHTTRGSKMFVILILT